MIKKIFKVASYIIFFPIKALFWGNFYFFRMFPYYIRRTFIWNETNYKYGLINNIRKHYNIKYFIETGTYLGDTSLALANKFEKIFTVELNKKLFISSSQRLKKFKNVNCFNSSSELFLKKIISKIIKQSIFFLDAHYSGPGTSKSKNNFSCLKELEIIKKSKIKNHIIIIDDISDFSS